MILRSRIYSKEDKKGRKKRVQFPIGSLKLLWHSNGTSPSKKETKTSVQWNTRWNLSTRIDSASFVFHSWKMGATSWWYTVTKSHQSSPGPKRFTENRQLICQFIRQRNSHWATRASEVADIYSSFSQTLPFSLSLFLCASSCREVTYTFLILFHDSIVGDICSTTTRTTLRNKQRAFLSRVTWEESSLSEGGSQLDEIRTITSFLPSLKEPWNWIGSLSRCHGEKEAAPLVRHGEIKGARAVSRESGLHYDHVGSWIRIRVDLFFFTLEEFRQRFIDLSEIMYERLDSTWNSKKFDELLYFFKSTWNQAYSFYKNISSFAC